MEKTAASRSKAIQLSDAAPAGAVFPSLLLKEVSRSFYLTLRILPAAVRPQVGLAYLLARTTDTIADTELLPVETRMEALQNLRQRILGTNASPLNLGNVTVRQSSSAERGLLENLENSLMLLDSFSREDQRLIREVLATITSGQELDLQRFGRASPRDVAVLETEQELDDYTYRVAGCVGEFWTKICRAHLFPSAPLDDRFLLESGARFGKGLQLVNVLRDLGVDLRQGRCYMPRTRLAGAGLTPEALLDPGNYPKFIPLYDEYLRRTEEHLLAGWKYTVALPWGLIRLRLACAWPLLIAQKTIQRLRSNNVLDPQACLKISRNEVRLIILQSILWYSLPGAWRRLFHQISPGIF